MLFSTAVVGIHTSVLLICAMAGNITIIIKVFALGGRGKCKICDVDSQIRIPVCSRRSPSLFGSLTHTALVSNLFIEL